MDSNKCPEPGIAKEIAVLFKMVLWKVQVNHLYMSRPQGPDILILCLYVDDPMYTCTNQEIIKDFKRAMMATFEMVDLGLIKYFLSMQVK